MPERPRYVAMGSSFAAGPFIGRRSPGSPRRAGRSAANYAHLLAARLGLDLTDVTYSGATAAQMLDGQPGAGPAQISAVTAGTDLVTITCGGNDIGYLPRLTWASMPAPIRRRADEYARRSDRRLGELGGTFDRLTGEVRRRAPRARLLLVDYLTILPPDPDADTGRLPAEVAAWGREVAVRLSQETAAAAERAGAEYVAVSAASRDHHAWSAEPWTRRFRLSRAGAPYHPNAAGMRAVAEILAGVC
ncbi:lysophospholipase L1-like esterase [Actinoplanes tereljensis]|uniref:Hydrolase n=1 Tax=Paractinoplanes tereljensis TaxID=571912 RepID=A0A919NQX7_9ACTN|nr:SGNH/GDSL hydrolase family protein [Actinoplanes tereljensis]GIF23033.1 hydrolase [Actinoplanes tereljensis]